MTRKQTIFIYSCLFGGWMFGLGGAYLGDVWFSRFGSAIVLGAVMAEYELLQVQLSQLTGTRDGSPGSQFQPPSRALSLFAHLSVVLGTFIWGFGDLFL